MPGEDRHNALLVRDAMERTVAELPPVHDLLAGALAQGRRRRARARLAVAAGVACVAGAVVFGSVLLPGGGGGGATTVRPAASDVPEPYRTPVHIEPTSEGQQTMADLPPAERERQEQFQQRVAALLDKRLPDAVGLIRPIDVNVRRYQGEAEGGKVFPVIFSVRPAGEGSAPKSCTEVPQGQVKDGTCRQATLPGGIRAISYRMLSDGPGTTATLVSFSYGRSDVTLTVTPDTKATASAPVTSEEILAAAADPAFLDLVRYADENPMQASQTSVQGG
ncbi:hypothetical protein [Streptomyces sp. NPDC060031]|uniref:hypothetical protein n=1 Tax=Streptomyces sp. NPDC060031 TaxID=3347043 RepID=UPI0036CB1A36